MKKAMGLFCYALAVVCVVYAAGVIATGAAGTRFYLVWFLLAAGLAGLGYAVQRNAFAAWPLPVRAVCLTVSGAGLALFCLVEGLVLSHFSDKGEANLGYLIVLGAQMKENGPSVALARRLDLAAAYLMENPDTVCVVSGGRGSNEPISEAEGMSAYLVKKGIDPARIVLEEQSHNTLQNLVNSRRLIPEGETKVGVVTNRFHVYRSVQLAKKQGFPQAVGMGAAVSAYFIPNNMLREFFGVMKDWLQGNMRLIG